MKKRIYLILSTVILTVSVTVPSITFAWFSHQKDFGLTIKAGESVALIQPKAYKRTVKTDGGSYDVGYQNIVVKSEVVNTDDDSGYIKIELDDISFDYLNAAENEFITDVNFYPRVFIELDIIKEFFDAYLLCTLSSFSLTRNGQSLTENLFEYKLGIYANDPEAILTEATPTNAAALDLSYVDANGFLADGTPMKDGTTLDVFKVDDKTAQLAVPGFAERPEGSSEPVFSRALIVSFGVNPKWFLTLSKDNPDFFAGQAKIRAAFTFALTISNNIYPDLPLAEVSK